jgi:2-phosphoglycerate kinase
MEDIRQRFIWVEDKGQSRLPYSKGILAATIMVIGVPPMTAYQIAGEIEDRLIAEKRSSVPVDDIVKMAESSLRAGVGAAAATRYAAWVTARRRKRPILLLLGGGTGVGKSTIAAGVGSKLGITPVLPTDAVREVMRSSFPVDIAPTLHVSSFEAHTALRAPVPDDHDDVVVGFRQQTELVGSGVRGLVCRALNEATNLIVEGAHVLPGMFDDTLDEWRARGVVCQAIIHVPDPEMHRAHFLTRLERAPGREPQRYLDHFAEIRRIHRYVCRVADAAGVPQVVSDSLDDAVDTVVDMVVEAVVADHQASSSAR